LAVWSTPATAQEWDLSASASWRARSESRGHREELLPRFVAVCVLAAMVPVHRLVARFGLVEVAVEEQHLRAVPLVIERTVADVDVRRYALYVLFARCDAGLDRSGDWIDHDVPRRGIRTVELHFFPELDAGGPMRLVEAQVFEIAADVRLVHDEEARVLEVLVIFVGVANPYCSCLRILNLLRRRLGKLRALDLV